MAISYVKVAYFTSIFPYVLLTIILVRGATLPGAIDGINFYMIPDFNRLADATVSKNHLCTIVIETFLN